MNSNRELSTNLHFGWTNKIFDDCTIIAKGTHFIKDIPSPWLYPPNNKKSQTFLPPTHIKCANWSFIVSNKISNIDNFVWTDPGID